MTELRRPRRLVLIRHAESERNKAKKGSIYFVDDEARQRIRGIPDNKIPITPEGHRQARETGAQLRKQFGTPDYIYHSGYLRTEQTMEEILAAYPHEERAQIAIRMSPFIRERDSGYGYDMTTEEAAAAFPWLEEHWKTFGPFFARPPGGESLADTVNRVNTFLNMIFRDRAGQTVFVVSHGGTLRCLRFLLEKWTYEKLLVKPDGDSPHNCGVTDYEYDRKQKKLILRHFNIVHWT
jgi:broad specificity phosphatase PhoE